MTDATIEPNQLAEPTVMDSAAGKRDRARMKRIGSLHLTMVMAALTLWGAAETWAQVTGWGIAQVASCVNAVIGAWLISSTLHEWGHLAGARISGARSPMLAEPVRHFFVFDFKTKENDVRQFIWMSWGGILVPWVLVALAMYAVPLTSIGGVVFLGTFIARAVSVSVFEVPVVRRVERSGDPIRELERQLGSGFVKSRYAGAVAGVVSFLVIRIVA